MLKVSRAICWQVGALVIAIVFAIVLFALPSDRQFYRGIATARDELGCMGAVCYPLLFAACNILLLPGGILAVGGGFFLDCGGDF